SVTGSDKYIAVNKGNSTYFHFWNGMNSTAMTFRDPSLNPRKAILCNNGKELPIRFSTLPTFVDKEHIARTKYHSVTNIPVDDLAGEPIVIRIDW
ncbi:MAG: hypothetical protein K6D94_05050, partial [Clostridiales bacterium]|nr:hypothetical protein [Clostridiales bacterium]